MHKSAVIAIAFLLLQGTVLKAQEDPLKEWRELPAHKWQQLAVLYAEVGDAEKLVDGKRVKLTEKDRTKESLGDCYIQLKPLATLTGNFDCALHKEFVVHASIRGFGLQLQPSDIPRVPGEGAKVIVLVHWRSGKYNVRQDSVAFFPKNEENNRPALCPVENFEDPKVKEVIEALRKIRAEKGSADPNTGVK